MRTVLLVLEGIELSTGEPLPSPHPYGPEVWQLEPGSLRDLELPVLCSLGLGEIIKGRVFDPPARRCSGSYGRVRRQSSDETMLGCLWELAGVINHEPFASCHPAIPEALLAATAEETGIAFLGGGQLSLEKAVEEYGEVHLKTGRPIAFSSDGSTMEIAVHQSLFSLASLAQLCRTARRHGDEVRLANLVGHLLDGPDGAWTEAAPPHAFPLVPPKTILNALSERGLHVEGIGTLSQAFAQSGMTTPLPTENAQQTLETINERWERLDRGLLFANLSLVCPSAPQLSRAPSFLESVDDWLSEFLEETESDDLVIISGTTPSGQGEAPVLLSYDGRTGPLGIRSTFADVAATLAEFFNLKGHERNRWQVGTPLISFHRHPGSLIP
ncbi:MAG TPA: hypothetical protein VNQ90_12170 [Chthoniobacteraceae bacterium]|nr:hypothetical protein [Chthoniobacteraceae bacterium]